MGYLNDAMQFTSKEIQIFDIVNQTVIIQLEPDLNYILKLPL